eukprot:12183149-Alexandrium_andersonii.AAC.1
MPRVLQARSTPLGGTIVEPAAEAEELGNPHRRLALEVATEAEELGNPHKRLALEVATLGALEALLEPRPAARGRPAEALPRVASSVG